MHPEMYSSDKASEEAAKLKNIVGAKGSSQDYETAQEIVRDELVDNYLSFDKSLFCANNWTPSRTAQEKNISEAQQQYREILQQDNIRQVLAGQSPTELIPVATIQALRNLVGNETTQGSIMIKGPQFYMLEPLLAAAEVPSLDEARQEYFASRIKNHLFRLLLPEIYHSDSYRNREYTKNKQNTVCPAFAKDYIRFIAQLPAPQEEEAQKVNRTIGAEGEGVRVFWTIAPYINDESRRAGLSPAESMQGIFNWIDQGYQNKKESSDGYASLSWDGRDVPYLDRVAWPKCYLDFTLGFDERMPSHLLARLYAKSMIEQMNKAR